MKCTNCGHELPEGALFCNQCGQAMPSNQENTLESNQENTPESNQENTPESDQENTPESDQENTPESDQENTPESNQENTPESNQVTEKDNLDKQSSTSSGIKKWQTKWKETYTIFVLIGVLVLAAGGGLLFRNLRGRQENDTDMITAPNGGNDENLAEGQTEDTENPEESEKKDGQEGTKETEDSAGATNTIAEEDINQIEKNYNQIISQILEGSYSKIILRNGVVVYRDGSDVKSVVVSKGIDGNAYARSYYYLNGSLMYASYEDTDAHNFYFHNGSLIRWGCMKDASNLQAVENFDMDDSWAYSNWEKTVQEESDVLKEEIDALPQKAFRMANVVDVSATSVLSEPNKIYAASQLIDGDVTEAWIEGVSGQGINETITIYFDDKYPVSGITIHAGFQRRADLYERNSRPSELRISYADGMSEVYKLQDVNGAQTIDFSDTIVTDYISLSIVSVYPGSEWEDTAISEVSIYSRE